MKAGSTGVGAVALVRIMRPRSVEAVGTSHRLARMTQELEPVSCPQAQRVMPTPEMPPVV